MSKTQSNSDSETTATATEIAELLRGQEFPNVEAMPHDKQSSVTFRVPSLCGVNVPWLSSEMEERGWHVKSIDAVSGTTITVEEGTNPCVP